MCFQRQPFSFLIDHRSASRHHSKCFPRFFFRENKIMCVSLWYFIIGEEDPKRTDQIFVIWSCIRIKGEVSRASKTGVNSPIHWPFQGGSSVAVFLCSSVLFLFLLISCSSSCYLLFCIILQTSVFICTDDCTDSGVILQTFVLMIYLVIVTFWL